MQSGNIGLHCYNDQTSSINFKIHVSYSRLLLKWRAKDGLKCYNISKAELT